MHVYQFTATTAGELVLLGFAVGIVGTLIGAGGGFILTPALLIAYPLAQPELITAISLVVVVFNATAGSPSHSTEWTREPPVPGSSRPLRRSRPPPSPRRSNGSVTTPQRPASRARRPLADGCASPVSRPSEALP